MTTRYLRRKLGIEREVDIEAVKEGVPLLFDARRNSAKKLKRANEWFRELKRDPNSKVRKQRRLVKKYELQDLKHVNNQPEKLKQIPVPISKEALVSSIELLERHEASSKPKGGKDRVILNSCKRHSMARVDHESWDTAYHIIKSIRHAVATHDWDNLTHLLLLLLDHNECYLPFVKEISFLNVLMNRADYNSEVLDAFVQQIFCDVTTKPTEFDVWYTEDGL